MVYKYKKCSKNYIERMKCEPKLSISVFKLNFHNIILMNVSLISTDFNTCLLGWILEV